MGRRSTGRRRGKVSPRGLARFLLLYRSSEFARHVELRVGHRGAGRSIGAGHRDARRVAMPPRKGDARDVMRRGTHLDVDADPDWGGSCARSMHRAAFCAAADWTRTGIPPRARGKPAAGPFGRQQAPVIKIRVGTGEQRRTSPRCRTRSATSRGGSRAPSRRRPLGYEPPSPSIAPVPAPSPAAPMGRPGAPGRPSGSPRRVRPRRRPVPIPAASSARDSYRGPGSRS